MRFAWTMCRSAASEARGTGTGGAVTGTRRDSSAPEGCDLGWPVGTERGDEPTFGIVIAGEEGLGGSNRKDSVYGATSLLVRAGAVAVRCRATGYRLPGEPPHSPTGLGVAGREVGRVRVARAVPRRVLLGEPDARVPVYGHAVPG